MFIHFFYVYFVFSRRSSSKTSPKMKEFSHLFENCRKNAIFGKKPEISEHSFLHASL